MKKFIALILCILMIVPCFVFSTSAEEEAFHDISKESLLKASSQWNYYSAPKYTIDGKIDSVTCEVGGYEYWRPNAPGRDPSVNIKDSWIEYRYSEYKEIESVVMYAVKHNTNTRYRLQALVMGEWYELPALYNNDAEIYKYTYDKKEYNGGTIIIKWDIDEMVKKYNQANPDKPLPEGNLNTKKFRVYFDYSDQWAPPIIFETIITGRKGVVPAFDVPDDAELSTNAALSGHMYASSSQKSPASYPAFGADNVTSTAWLSANTTDGEWIKAEFDKPYNITNLTLDFGGASEVYSFNIEVELLQDDGTWQTEATKAITTSKSFDNTAVNIFEGDDINCLENIRGIKVTFTGLNGKPAMLSEMNATIAGGGKCIFLAGWMTTDRKQSVALGNIAIYGKAYCSSAFDYIGISEVSYINDGQILDSSPAWYAGELGKGEYCGIALNIPNGKKATVTKVILNFNDVITYDYTNPITYNRENKVKDDYVLGFDLQAKQADGTYKTIASGTSYDTTSKSYIVAFDFTDLVTDDIRVVFTSNNAGYAYLKEIEVYASDVEYGSATNGYCNFPHQRSKAKGTTSFGTPFFNYRAAFMDLVAPISK